MKFFRLLLICILFFNFKINGQVKKNSTPKWVKITNYNEDPKIDESTIEQGLLSVLYDHQINEITKEFYYRFATKVTENVGVQSGSSIDITYDPTYQNLTLNTIKIIRNGETIDKLKVSEFQEIRKELNSENFIYDGSLSAINNITDVRIGDIIDYSYTIKGENPIYKNNFSTFLYLNNVEPLGKLNIRIISNKKLDFKYLNTDVTFNETKKGNKYYNSLERENIEGFEYDVEMPSWKFQYESVMVSDYKNWKNVIDWGIDVFNVNRKPSKKLQSKIDEIIKKNKTSGAKIKATLNFVENEIRYLGLESGIGAYKPFSPNKVMEQRFGDCKDKSLLLVTMLEKMNIEAYPMLVNTYLKESINKVLPTPNMFDHCVVKVIDKEVGTLFFDPTISNQGGNFDTTPFPDYRYGLVLKKNNSEFDQLYSLSNNNIEITDYYELEEVGKGAILKTTSVYFDDQADYMRTYYKNNSINSIKKEYENFYATYFYDIRSLSDPKFKDNIKENKFTTFEEYKIDSIWQPALDKNQITTSFYPYAIINSLNLPNKSLRASPFAIVYPLTRTHEINVKLPEKWNIERENFSINAPSFFYNFDAKYNENKNLLSLNYILKTQKDYVTKEEFREYYEKLKQIDTNVTYSLIIPKGYVASQNNGKSFLEYLGVFIFMLALALAIWLGLKIYNYDPEPKIESYFEKNKKINGWIILIGIGLCLSPFKILYDLTMTKGILLNGNWVLFFDSSYSGHNISLGFIIFIELLVNVLTFVLSIVFIFLFFKRRSSFPKVYSFTLIFLFLFLIFDTILVNYFTKANNSFIENKEIIISFIRTGLVASYLLLSDNVKEVFVKRKQ